MLDSFLACVCVLEFGDIRFGMARGRQADSARSTSSENHTVRRPEWARADVLGVFGVVVCIASSRGFRLGSVRGNFINDYRYL